MKIKDSLRRRYFAKLIANFVSLGAMVVTHMVIPRALGPSAYGNFNYVTNFFTQLIGVFDTGTSTCFYIKLSQRPKETGLIAFYAYFVFGVSLLILLFNAVAFALGMEEMFWPGQETVVVFAAAIWALLVWGTDIINKINDAMGLTVSSENIRIIQTALSLALIVAMYFAGAIGIHGIFLYYYFSLVFLGTAWIVLQIRNGVPLIGYLRLRLVEGKEYLQEFYKFSHPLFVYSVAGIIPGLVDRWLLQNYAGSVEQGFFGLSYRIGTLAFFFASTMSPLITREFSQAFGDNDMGKVQKVFSRYLPLFYAISGYCSLFLAFNADVVVTFVGGTQYIDALLAVSIMCIFPMHQTYGQLGSSVFFSSGQTGTYRNIGVAGMFAGLPVTFFLVAPSLHHGLDLGAVGLAVKVVLMQIIMVNVQLWYVTKIIGLSFSRFVLHQAAVLVVFGLFAGLSRGLTSFLGTGMIVKFIVCGALYSTLVIAAVYAFPALIGFNRDELSAQLSDISRKILSKG